MGFYPSLQPAVRVPSQRYLLRGPIPDRYVLTSKTSAPASLRYAEANGSHDSIRTSQ